MFLAHIGVTGDGDGRNRKMAQFYNTSAPVCFFVSKSGGWGEGGLEPPEPLPMGMTPYYMKNFSSHISHVTMTN